MSIISPAKSIFILKLNIIKTTNVITYVGSVVYVMYFMCEYKSVPAIAGARFVVSLRGDNLSPK